MRDSGFSDLHLHVLLLGLDKQLEMSHIDKSDHPALLHLKNEGLNCNLECYLLGAFVGYAHRAIVFRREEIRVLHFVEANHDSQGLLLHLVGLLLPSELIDIPEGVSLLRNLLLLFVRLEAHIVWVLLFDMLI